MDRAVMLEQVEELVGPVLMHLGYELVEREFVQEGGRAVLRLYIDTPGDGGVTIADCERASRGIEDVIEVEGLIPQAYSLEVSSPGIDRPLRRRGDFERFTGRTIRLKTAEPVEGRSNYKGTLEGIEGDDIVMAVDGSHYRVPFAKLAKARLVPEDDTPRKGQRR